MSKKLFMSLFVLLGVSSLLLFGCHDENINLSRDILKGEWNIVADINNNVVTFKDDLTVTFDELTYTFNNEDHEYQLKGDEVDLNEFGTYKVIKEGDCSLRLYQKEGTYLQLIKGQKQDVQLNGQYNVKYRVGNQSIKEVVEFNETFKDYRDNQLNVEASYTNKDQLLVVKDIDKAFYTYAYNETIILVETGNANVWELVK